MSLMEQFMKQQVSHHGLHLQGKQIRQLSGPGSMYYLKPSEEAWHTFHKKGIDLPLILLMGDIHASEEGRCYPCVKNSGHFLCYSLEDKAFLRLFDQLAEHTPIDFFTETSEEKSTTTHVGVISRLEHATQRAHRVAQRSQRPRPNNENDPLIPTMRWHHANARIMSGWIESQLHIAYVFYLKDLVSARKKKTPLPATPILPEEVRKLQYSVLMEVIAPASSESVEETIHRIIAMTLKALSGPFAHQSRIMKQYRQSALSNTLSMEMFIPLIAESMIRNHFIHSKIRFFREAYESDTKNEPAFQHMNRLMESLLLSPSDVYSLPPHEDDPDVTLYLDELSNALMGIGSFIMDLYFLFRMLKEPKGSTTATLSIAYMGVSHIRALVFLLTHPLFGYTVSYSHPESMKKTYPRCISFDSPIYLESDVMEHHQRRFAEQPELLARWHRVLHQEKQSREQANNLRLPSLSSSPSPSPSPSSSSPCLFSPSPRPHT